MNPIKYWLWTHYLDAWWKIKDRKKCSCGHPLWMHQCYQHGTCIHGVCLAETFSFEVNVVCCCQGFNDMWNKEYPTNKPELRITSLNKGNAKV